MEEQDRHQEQIYLYSSINKRSQVNHTFVLKLEHNTLHVLKKARKFPQTGTAAPSAGSVHLLLGTPASVYCSIEGTKCGEASPSVKADS